MTAEGTRQETNLIHRKQNNEEELDMQMQAQADIKFGCSLGRNLKYYFNRFRYYHYYYVDKCEMYVAAACLMLIKVMFFLMGYPSAESTALSYDDE